jgi:hypothetical protein
MYTLIFVYMHNIYYAGESLSSFIIQNKYYNFAVFIFFSNFTSMDKLLQRYIQERHLQAHRLPPPENLNRVQVSYKVACLNYES